MSVHVETKERCHIFGDATGFYDTETEYVVIRKGVIIGMFQKSESIGIWGDNDEFDAEVPLDE